MQQNFLLSTPQSRRLYEEVACHLPIIDFHNHLSIRELAENRQFQDIAELWLLSDPYKHRVMRICGVEERYITGDTTSHYDKFEAWCGIFPKLLGNALYDWSRIELEQVLCIRETICKENAKIIWNKANEKLKTEEYSAQSLLRKFHVQYVSPCASLTHDVDAFRCMPELAPSLRGDDLLLPTPDLLRSLERQTGERIDDRAAFCRAVTMRLDAFSAAGCRFADQALDSVFQYLSSDGKEEARFQKFLKTGAVQPCEAVAFRSDLLRLLGGLYAQQNWVLQLHIGAQRLTSTRLRNLLGDAGGFAGIGHTADLSSLVRLLDDLEQSPQGMPSIFLFTLNPADNAAFSVLSGSFVQDGVRGKLMQGAAWWWCDHVGGMRETFESIASYSVLSCFAGMTTDSRSLLSLCRHDYFRRAFCGWLGEKVSSGQYPDSFELLADVVRAVCYENINTIVKEGRIL